MSHMKLLKGIGLATVLVASLFVLVSAAQINCDNVNAICDGTRQDDVMTAANTIRTANDGVADILGYEGDDQIMTTAANDVDAGSGDDKVSGSTSGDDILGGPGDDRLFGNGGGDVIGAPTLSTFTDARNDADSCLQGDIELGDDVITVSGGSVNFVCGGEGADRISAIGTAANLLLGGHGNDLIQGSSGGDVIGDRTYTTAADAAPASSDEANVTRHCDASDEPGNDRLLGGNGDDHLCGGSGNDILDGGAASDASESPGGNVLEDGPGSDRLIGGANSDTFILFPDNTADRVHAGDGDDFVFVPDFSGSDRIECGNGDDTVTVTSNSDAVEAKTGEKLTSVNDGDSLGSCETVNIN